MGEECEVTICLRTRRVIRYTLIDAERLSAGQAARQQER